MAVFIIAACADDKGNYSYQELNDLTIDMPADIQAMAYEKLKVTPQVQASPFQENDYTYQWTAYDNTEVQSPVVLGHALNLDTTLVMKQGVYQLVLRVTHKETGVFYQQQTTMHVSTPTSQGWLVLTDDEGRACLDMVSHVKQPYQVYHDLLQAVEPGSWQGPRSLVVDVNMQEPFYLVTHEGTTRLSNSDFDWNESMLIGNEFASGSYTGSVAGLAAHRPGKVIVDEQGQVYYCNTLMGDGLFASKRDNGFITSPLIGYNALNNSQFVPAFMLWDRSNLCFNVCAQEFATLGMTTLEDYPMASMAQAGFPVLGDDVFEWPQRRDRFSLVYLENTRYDKNRDENGLTYAILKNRAGEYWLYGIILGDLYSFAEAKYGAAYEKVCHINLSALTDIDKASQFAFSSLKMMMYYAVENKVYRVNLSNTAPTAELQIELPMDENISLMKFYLWQQDDVNHHSYDLIVASEDTESSMYALRIYEGFDSEGDFAGQEPVEHYTGFARIQDVIYRERLVINQ